MRYDLEFNGVRANFFCAFLLRTQIHTPRASMRAQSKKMNKDSADGLFHSFAWI